MDMIDFGRPRRRRGVSNNLVDFGVILAEYVDFGVELCVSDDTAVDFGVKNLEGVARIRFDDRSGVANDIEVNV